MTREISIIEFGSWLESPAGQYLCEWELAQFDMELANVFGFHALQIGLPGLDTLRANRMPHRWIACDLARSAPSLRSECASADGSPAGLRLTWDLLCQAEALPLPADCMDLVVLPHTLELSCDPHQALAEVARVLRPEGKVVLTGLNPLSLWGLRNRLGRCQWRGRPLAPFLPQVREFVAHWRLRDWLRLLGFELEVARLGCYRPPLSSAVWLERCAWLESVGARSWPVLGAAYFLVATKRVQGIRLVGLSREARSRPHAVPAAVASRQTD